MRRKGILKPPAGGESIPVYIAADIGNKLVKVVLVSPNAKGNWPCTVYPHALKDHTDTEFNQLASREKMTRHDRSINRLFGYVHRYTFSDGSWEQRTRWVTVGENAADLGKIDHRSGSLKYERYYYAPLLIGGLLELLPNGWDNIHIMAMYPPGDVDYLPELMDSLGGTHKIQKPDGNIVKYAIKTVRAADEPIGGLMHRIVGMDGRNYADHGLTGTRVLVIDIGGQVSSMVPATTSGNINYQRAKSFQLGIYDVLSDFERELRQEYPAFRRLRNPSDSQMREALDTGWWQGGGYDPLDCSRAKEVAIGRIMNQIMNIYENEMGGTLSYDHILITGGGGALLEPMLREHLGHGSIHRAEARSDEMHLANVRGAAKMFIAQLISQGRWKNG